MAVYFGYVDDSGDRGATGSKTYILACVLLPADDWPSTFDDVIAFRRFLRDHFGLPVRAEMKANHMIRNGGAFRPLGLPDTVRRRIYRLTMRLHAKLGFLTFAIQIDKAGLLAIRPDADPRDVAWEYMLQRLERFTTKGHNTVLLIHDEGEALLIRKLARKARRAGTAGSMMGVGYLKVPARLLLDDPVPRDSKQSYFLQFADLAAYAAYRRIHPPPAGPHIVCPQDMWDELGVARFDKVNQYSGGPPGIVSYP
jgi:hypothetical protein